MRVIFSNQKKIEHKDKLNKLKAHIAHTNHKKKLTI
jgi:hypothetical protein